MESFLSVLPDETRPVYQDVIRYLSGLGYHPRKERSYLLFMHPGHQRQMVKMGITHTKDHSPYFALRFSACQDYSRRFAEIVKANIEKNPDRLFPHCKDGKCIFYAQGENAPAYRYVYPDGTQKALCGAKALVITEISAQDVGEIKRLIQEEHEYLMAHETSIQTG